MLQMISLGAGVQSSAMALMAAAGELTPMPVVAIFADTGDEPQSVYHWLDWLEKQLPFPVERVRAKVTQTYRWPLSATELTVVEGKRTGKTYRKNLIPAFGDRGGMFPRRCTADYKVRPIRIRLRQLVRLPHRIERREGVYVTQWIGISIDEASRMKESRDQWAVNRYPLIEAGVSREGCLQWMAARGYPTPPRSACVYCPYHSDQEWIRLRDEEPAEFARAVHFEEELQAAARQVRTQLPFLHDSLIPLRLVPFDATRGKRRFENECEGRCGV